jgi:hypothetical protein
MKTRPGVGKAPGAALGAGLSGEACVISARLGVPAGTGGCCTRAGLLAAAVAAAAAAAAAVAATTLLSINSLQMWMTFERSSCPSVLRMFISRPGSMPGATPAAGPACAACA